MRRILLLTVSILTVVGITGCSSSSSTPTAKEARQCFDKSLEKTNNPILEYSWMGYVRNGDVTITKFEKVDGVSNNDETYDLIIKVEAIANKDTGKCFTPFEPYIPKYTGESRQASSTPEKPRCPFKKDETYSEQIKMNFKKSEQGWRTQYSGEDCLISR